MYVMTPNALSNSLLSVREKQLWNNPLPSLLKQPSPSVSLSTIPTLRLVLKLEYSQQLRRQESVSECYRTCHVCRVVADSATYGTDTGRSTLARSNTLKYCSLYEMHPMTARPSVRGRASKHGPPYRTHASRTCFDCSMSNLLNSVYLVTVARSDSGVCICTGKSGCLPRQQTGPTADWRRLCQCSDTPVTNKHDYNNNNNNNRHLFTTFI